MVAVAAWSEFESAAPDMAAVAHLLWPGMMALAKGEPKAQERPWFPIAFLATIRPDGGPRLHPFCPVLADGRLFAAIPQASTKRTPGTPVPRSAGRRRRKQSARTSSDTSPINAAEAAQLAADVDRSSRDLDQLVEDLGDGHRDPHASVRDRLKGN